MSTTPIYDELAATYLADAEGAPAAPPGGRPEPDGDPEPAVPPGTA